MSFLSHWLQVLYFSSEDTHNYSTLTNSQKFLSKNKSLKKSQNFDFSEKWGKFKSAKRRFFFLHTLVVSIKQLKVFFFQMDVKKQHGVVYNKATYLHKSRWGLKNLILAKISLNVTKFTLFNLRFWTCKIYDYVIAMYLWVKKMKHTTIIPKFCWNTHSSFNMSLFEITKENKVLRLL